MIPAVMKIGGQDYKIIRQEEIKDEKNNLCLGICEPDKNQILLRSDLKGDKAWEVLIHECLHGIEEVWNVNLGESRVHTLGHAIYALFKDNGILGTPKKTRAKSRR